MNDTTNPHLLRRLEHESAEHANSVRQGLKGASDCNTEASNAYRAAEAEEGAEQRHSRPQCVVQPC